MKITVMGPGGVGGYFGARLAAAGNDVTFVARGAHLAAMQAERPAPRQRPRQPASQPRQGRGQCRRRSRPRTPSSSRSRCATPRARRKACGRWSPRVPRSSPSRTAWRARERIGQDRRRRQCGGRCGAHRLQHPRARRDQADRQVRDPRVRRARRQAQRRVRPRSTPPAWRPASTPPVRQHLAHLVAQVRHAGAGRRHDRADARAARAHPQHAGVLRAAEGGGGGDGRGRRGAENGARARGCRQDHKADRRAARRA